MNTESKTLELFPARYNFRDLRMSCGSKRGRWHLLTGPDTLCSMGFGTICLVPAQHLGCYYCYRVVHMKASKLARRYEWPYDTESLLVLSDRLMEEDRPDDSDIVHAAAANHEWRKYKAKFKPR